MCSLLLPYIATKKPAFLAGCLSSQSRKPPPVSARMMRRVCDMFNFILALTGLCCNYAFTGKTKGCPVFLEHIPVVLLSLFALECGQPCLRFFNAFPGLLDDTKNPFKEVEVICSRVNGSGSHGNFFKLYGQFLRRRRKVLEFDQNLIDTNMDLSRVFGEHWSFTNRSKLAEIIETWFYVSFYFGNLGLLMGFLSTRKIKTFSELEFT